MDELWEIAAEFVDVQEFEIVTVSRDKSRDVATATHNDHEVPGILLFEPGLGFESDVARAFRVSSVPHTELIISGESSHKVRVSSPRISSQIRLALVGLGVSSEVDKG